MDKRKSWHVGIVLLLVLAGLMWFLVISVTDVARVGQEESGGKIELPEIPSVSLPNLQR